MVSSPIVFKRDITESSLELKEPEFEVNPDDPVDLQVITAIRGIFDPEISVNIYDLGLIYNIDINENSEVSIDMTLTAAACPVAGSLPGQVERVVSSLEPVKSAKVTLVWEPPWSREMMSDEAKLTLGLL